MCVCVCVWLGKKIMWKLEDFNVKWRKWKNDENNGILKKLNENLLYWENFNAFYS
jgi:hypothetical protein